jgi:cytochrome c
MLDEQNQHFGEALGLDATIVAEIREFLEKNAAETGMTEPAYKINRSIPATMTPLRVTETGYWMEKHKDIPVSMWRHPKVGSKSNCSACHLDADRGTYEDAAMRLPR